MMRKATSFAALWILMSASGCSLLVDTAPYLGDDARTDGGVGQDGAVARDGATGDGSVDPEAPSKPEIQITPEEPRTGEALRVEIVAESVDPAGAGPVTYEYAWQLDEEETEHASETIAAGETRRTQRWSVSVVAVAADGARRSEPATASVTIANAPPTVMTVGLSQYRPVTGEVIRATPGVRRDADGDPIVLRYAWRRNGELIAGQSSDRLNLGAIGAEAGDRIEVELTVNDRMEDGDTVSAGPAIVLEDVTRWRQLLPERIVGEKTVVAFDAGHRRVLLASFEGSGEDFTLWEYSLDGSSSLVQLHPEGEAPGSVALSRWIYDARNRRVLVFGAQRGGATEPSTEVFVLDVSRRGAERWSVVAGGPGPAIAGVGVYVGVAYDEARQEAFVYGGYDPGVDDLFLNELWTIDLSSPESASWARRIVPLPPEPLVYPILVSDPERDRVLLFGGVVFRVAEERSEASFGIYSLALERPETGFSLESASLPRLVAASTHGVDGGELFIVSGPIIDDDDGYEDLLVVDLATLATSSRPLGGEVPALPTIFGFLARDPGADRLVLSAGSFADLPFSVHELEPSTASFTPIHRTGVDLPGPLERALAIDERPGLRIYGGIDHRSEVRDELWEFRGGEWTRLNPLPDAITGRTPGPRAGAVLDANNPWADLRFMGGVGADQVLADGTVWLLAHDRWVEQTLETGAVMPAPRQGAMFYHPGCGSDLLSYFGGEQSAWDGFDDTATLKCESADRYRECAWRDPTEGAPGPEGRAYGAIARTSASAGPQRAILFGGTADDASVWSLAVCAGGATAWEEETVVSGTPIGPRTGHSMTRVVEETSTPETSLLILGGNDLEHGSYSDELALLVYQEHGGVRWESVELPEGEAPPARAFHVAVFDRSQKRLLVYGGQGRNGWQARSDMWELRWRPEAD